LGFDDIGFSNAEKLEHLESPYSDWIKKGYNGQMSWLEKNTEERLDPNKLIPGTKTVISLLSYYYSEEYDSSCGVSRYAVGRDYHKVLKKKGNELITFIRGLSGEINARAFVDSAPIMEREWAKRAGLGWIGKNGCLIQAKHGSWFFISEILIDLDIPADEQQEKNHCGTCTKCIDACPTNALLGDGLLDANKCISYLSIEYKGDFNKDSHETWDNWIFGCDICQDVCPWNKKPKTLKFLDLKPRKSVMELSANLASDEMQDVVEESILGTPLKRTGVAGLIRNFNWIKPISD